MSETPTVETPRTLRFICHFNITSITAGTFQNDYLVHATDRDSIFTHVTRNNMAILCLYNQHVTSPCHFQRNSVLECSAQCSDKVRTNQKLHWTLSVSCLFSQTDKNSHAFVLRRIRLRSQLITPSFHIKKGTVNSFLAIFHSGISLALLMLGISTLLNYRTTSAVEC